MAYCGAEPTSCNDFDGIGKHWFKIQEVGLQSGTIRSGQWALKNLMSGNYTWTTKVPEKLAGGAYLLRHEIIALHVPFEPEFYPECAHLWVTGNGNETPTEQYLASIPGVYAQEGMCTNSRDLDGR